MASSGPFIIFFGLRAWLPEFSAPIFQRVPTYRRIMPSFCMRDWSVLRFIPSIDAAPLGPPTTQLEASRASRMWRRSASSIVITGAGRRDGIRAGRLWES